METCSYYYYWMFCSTTYLSSAFQKVRDTAGGSSSLDFRWMVSCCQSLSCVQLFATVACQASLSMEFSRQKYWCELPLPSPGDLPDLVIKPRTCISCIGRQILYCRATREALEIWLFNTESYKEKVILSSSFSVPCYIFFFPLTSRKIF